MILTVVRKEHFLAVLQKNKNAPTDYTDGFQRAKAVFHRQTVLNPALMVTTAKYFLNSCGAYQIIFKYFSLITTLIIFIEVFHV